MGADAADFGAVLDAAQRGQAAGFARLFELVAEPLVAYFRARRVRHPDRLANDALVRAFENIGQFAGSEAGFRAWVFSIGRSRVVEIDAGTRMRRASNDTMDRALAALTPDEREVLLLRYVSDLTLEITAGTLDLAHHDIEELEQSALETIREHLATANHARTAPVAAVSRPRGLTVLPPMD